MKINIFSRMDKNDLNITKNIFCNFMVKGGAMIVSLLTMPAYFRYFEDEKILGVWFTILSMITWIINFDLGIGNGLRNHLVEAIAEKNRKKMKYYISSAYFSISAVIIALMLGFLSVYKRIDWFKIFSISESTDLNIQALQKTLLIVFTGVMLQFVLKLISSILYALQKSAMISFLGLLSNILILIYISFAPSHGVNENIINMAYVNTLSVNIPLLIATIVLFNTSLKGSGPNYKYCKKKYIRQVMELGLMFFFVQVCYMLFINTNEFIISWVQGPEYVVEFQAYNRIYTIVGTICNLALIPIWSAVTKALNEKNIKWIKKSQKRLYFLSFGATLIQLCIVPLTGIIMRLWLNNKVKCNYQYALVFAVFGSLMIWNAVFSSIANGLGKPIVQAIVFSFSIVLKFIVAYYIKTYNLSWIYIIVATIGGLLIYVVVQKIYINKYIVFLEREGAIL